MPDGVGFEALPAARVAEVVRDTLVRRPFTCPRDGDGHPADGVHGFGQDVFGSRPGMSPGDELREDGDGDLLLA